MGGGSHQRGRPFPSKARGEGEEDGKAPARSGPLQHYKETTAFGRDVAVGGGGGSGSKGFSSEVEEGLMKECFTKRKAAAGTFDEKKQKKAAVEDTFDEEKKKAAEGTFDEEKKAAEGTFDEEKKAAEGTFDEEEAAAGILDKPAAPPEAGEKLTRLSQDIVDYILAWEPRSTRDPDEYYATMMSDPLKCFPQEYIDEATAMLRELAETNKRTNAKFKVFQDWARAEFEAKGCVEVDDTYIAQRVLFEHARAKEELATAMDSQGKEEPKKGSAPTEDMFQLL